MEEELNDGSLLSKKEEGLAVEGTMRMLPYTSALRTFHFSALPVLCSNPTSDREHKWAKRVCPKSPWEEKKKSGILLLPRWIVQ